MAANRVALDAAVSPARKGLERELEEIRRLVEKRVPCLVLQRPPRPTADKVSRARMVNASRAGPEGARAVVDGVEQREEVVHPEVPADMDT